MDPRSDVDDRKRRLSDNENGELKRPIDMTMPERIGVYNWIQYARPECRVHQPTLSVYFHYIVSRVVEAGEPGCSYPF